MEMHRMAWPDIRIIPPPRLVLQRHLLDFLILQLDLLIIHKNALSLVWFRYPPLANISGKLHDHLLLHALQ